jgi:hypothetical protein
VAGFGSLLLQGFTPVLVAPAAGVGRVHADHRDSAADRHADQPIPELGGGNSSDVATQSFPPFSAAEGFPAGGAGVGEVEILRHDRRAVVLLGVIEQGGDRRAYPTIALGSTEARGEHFDAGRLADRITVCVGHANSEVAVVEVDPQHPPAAQFIKRGCGFGGGLSGRVEVPAVTEGVVVDVVAHRPAASDSIGPLITSVTNTYRRSDHHMRTEPGYQSGRCLDSQLAVVGNADGLLPPALPDSPSAVTNVRAASQRSRHCCAVMCA